MLLAGLIVVILYAARAGNLCEGPRDVQIQRNLAGATIDPKLLGNQEVEEFLLWFHTHNLRWLRSSHHWK